MIEGSTLELLTLLIAYVGGGEKLGKWVGTADAILSGHDHAYGGAVGGTLGGIFGIALFASQAWP
jgi:hypothetical protein